MGRTNANASAPPARPPPGYADESQHSPTPVRSPAPYPPPAGDDDVKFSTDGTDSPVVIPPTQETATYPPQPVEYPPIPESPAAYPPPSPKPTAYPPHPQPVPYPPSSGNMPQSAPRVFSPAGTQATPLHGYPGSVSPYPVGKPWSSGLYDFDRNSNNAVMTAFFPCVTFGQIAEILDEGQTSCTLGSIMYLLLMPVLACTIVGSTYRKRLRMKYNLVQAPAEDWILHLFCPCCSLCQEYRELQARGIDPSLGWLGNIALQQEMASAPAVQTMNK